MPIDLASVNWVYVGVLAIFVFVSTFVGTLLSLNSRGSAAVLSALVFAAIFVFWTYYPHGLPLPTAAMSPAPTTIVPAAPATSAPERPRNPVTTISPPPPPSQPR